MICCVVAEHIFFLEAFSFRSFQIISWQKISWFGVEWRGNAVVLKKTTELHTIHTK